MRLNSRSIAPISTVHSAHSTTWSSFVSTDCLTPHGPTTRGPRCLVRVPRAATPLATSSPSMVTLQGPAGTVTCTLRRPGATAGAATAAAPSSSATSAAGAAAAAAPASGTRLGTAERTMRVRCERWALTSLTRAGERTAARACARVAGGVHFVAATLPCRASAAARGLHDTPRVPRTTAAHTVAGAGGAGGGRRAPPPREASSGGPDTPPTPPRVREGPGVSGPDWGVPR